MEAGMDTLKKSLLEEAGLTDEQATKAMDVMMAFMREKLPEGILEEVEMLFATSKEEEDITRDIDVFKIP